MKARVKQHIELRGRGNTVGSLRDPVTTLPSPFKKGRGKTLGLNQRNMPTPVK